MEKRATQTKAKSSRTLAALSVANFSLAILVILHLADQDLLILVTFE